MDKIKARLKLLLPDIFLAILLASGISLALCASLLNNLSYIGVLYYTIFIMFICVLFFWNIFTFMGSVSAVSAGMVIFIAFFDKRHLISELLYYIGDSFFRVYNYITDEGNIDGLEKLITIFICSVVTMLVYFLLVRFKAYIIAVIAGGAVFAAQTILGFFTNNVSLYVFVISVVLIYFYEVSKTMDREFDMTGKSGIFLGSVIPLAVIIFICSALMPYSEEAIQWPWMDRKVTFVYDSIMESFNDFTGKNDFFDIGKTGLSDVTKFGGSVTQDYTEVLKVSGPKSIYLKALGRDIYTRDGWKDSYTEQKELMDKDGYAADELYEMNFGLKLLNSNYSYKDLFNVFKYDVSFLNIKTKSIFIPQGLAAIDDDSLKAKADYNISTSMDSKKKKDFKYEFIAQFPRYESPEFQETLRKSYDGLYNSYMRTRQTISWQWDDREQIDDKDSLASKDRELKISAYAKKADEIRSNYTKLPDNLPRRIKDLTLKITADQNTKYDKAKAIETYLSQNFPYTFTPGDTPKDRDFVDYFLFEQKQGYCVHFATAMAVMARTIGLPSRYVEGYRVPKEKNDDGSYTVLNKNAHAWVEIYFEGAGWVQFEPTAAFNGDFYRQEEKVSAGSEDLSFEDDEPVDTKDTLPMDDDIGTVSDQSSGTKIVKVLIYAAITLLIIALAVLVTVTVNIERRRHRIKKYKSLPQNKAMVKLYEELLDVLRKLGYGIKENETALQYGKRIDGLFYISPVSFGKLSRDFTEARYGSRQIDISKLEAYDKIYLRLLEIYKKEKGVIRYFIMHFLAGNI